MQTDFGGIGVMDMELLENALAELPLYGYFFHRSQSVGILRPDSLDL